MVGISRIQYTTDGQAFIVKREIKEARLKNPNYDILKQWFHCDTVIRNGDMLFFCNKIEYVEFEEVTEDSELINALKEVKKPKKVNKKKKITK